MLKKLLIILLSILSMCAFMTFVSCSADDEGEVSGDIVLTLKDSEIYLKKGSTYTLTYTVANAENPSPVWQSSDTSICTVDNGVVTAKSDGVAEVTLKIGGATKKCSVTVFSNYQVETLSQIEDTVEVYSACIEFEPVSNFITLPLDQYGLSSDRNATAIGKKGSETVELNVRKSGDGKKYFIDLDGFGSKIYGEGVSIEMTVANKKVTIPLKLLITKFITCREDLENLFFYGGMPFSFAEFNGLSKPTVNIIKESIIGDNFSMSELALSDKFDTVLNGYETNTYYTSASQDEKVVIMQQLPESKNLVLSIFKDAEKKARYMAYCLHQYDGYYIQLGSIDLESVPLEYRAGSSASDDLITCIDMFSFIDRDHPNVVGRRAISSSENAYFNVDIGFMGIYDGQGNVINNLSLLSFNPDNFNATQMGHGGVFGGISTKGVVKNLGIIAVESWCRFNWIGMYPMATNVNGTLQDVYVKGTLSNVNYRGYDNASKGIRLLGKAVSGATLTDVVCEFVVEDEFIPKFAGDYIEAFNYVGIDASKIPGTKSKIYNNNYKNCYFFHTDISSATSYESTVMKVGFESYDFNNIPNKTFEFENPEYWVTTSNGNPGFAE